MPNNALHRTVPKPPYGTPVRVFFGVIALLVGLYLAHGLLEGDIEYGQCAGRISKNCNVMHLTSPLELAVGTLHLGTLLFALVGLAVAPRFMLRKPIIISTAAVFAFATGLVYVV